MLRHMPQRLVENNIKSRAHLLALRALCCVGLENVKKRKSYLAHGGSATITTGQTSSTTTTTATTTTTTTTETRTRLKPITKLNILGEAATDAKTKTTKMSERKFEDLVFDPKGLKQSNDIDAENQERIDCEYEEAILALNTLQSNVKSIRKSIEVKHDSIKDTIKYLERSGLTLDEIEKNVSFIHVAGTKGKGSTCALTESLLRAYGIKTGFFSSPHIVTIPERVRINGEPLAKAEFTRVFWKVYKPLREKAENADDMPAYFKFMTIFSMHVFVEQKVDVAVLEVGIGGEFDCTNIIRNTKTIGICTLGLEHTELLGTTLAEIAWQKAGIIKPESSVFTLATQPECLKVLEQRAKENNAQLYRVLPFERYFKGTKYEKELESFNDVIHLNGSLSLQLAKDWLRRCRNVPDNGPNDTQMTDELLKGLQQWHWPARCQIVPYQNMNVHLDGAHTVESICVCADWFAKVTKNSKNPKILIFNRTGDSNSRPLLDVLRYNFEFDHVAFTPNVSASAHSNRKDQVMIRETSAFQLQRAERHMTNWCDVCHKAGVVANAKLYPSLTDVFLDLQGRWPPSQYKLDVLITGSIHLIGAAICALNELTLPVDGGDGDRVGNGNDCAPTTTQIAHTAKPSTLVKMPLSV